MGTISLVGGQIDDGGRLLEALTQGGLDVAAAAWVRPAEDDRWVLYVVSKDVDAKGPLAAYGAVVDALGGLSDSWLSMSEIKLVGGGDAVARTLLEVLRGHASRMPARPPRSVFGGASVDEMYVYPTAKRPHTDLTEDQKRLLEGLYAQTTLAVDDLPYTDEMEQIHEDFVRETGLALTTRDVFKALKNLGRQGRLGGKVRPQSQHDLATSPPPSPTP